MPSAKQRTNLKLCIALPISAAPGTKQGRGTRKVGSWTRSILRYAFILNYSTTTAACKNRQNFCKQNDVLSLTCSATTAQQVTSADYVCWEG
jgi:hypothetical protein